MPNLACMQCSGEGFPSTALMWEEILICLLVLQDLDPMSVEVSCETPILQTLRPIETTMII